jgi:uncharacterized protein (TIGR02145 family)
MKKTFSFLLALLLMGSCTADLWDAVHDLRDEDAALAAQDSALVARITQLETWATTVNTNIIALQGLVNVLQNNDYVTGVTSFTSPTPGGYIITFTQSAPITISNGEKGNTGDKGDDGITPQISIAKDIDDIYYWKLNGEWFLDGSSNKIPVTGAKGDKGTDGTPGSNGNDAIAPQIRINGATNFWEVSTDNGYTWVTTSIKATGEPGADGSNGEQGEQGPQGDAIFAANGIDNLNPNYVEFTLADDITKIKVPKYMAIGITFTQPDLFIADDIKTIDYTTTGAVATVVALNVPQGWKITANTSAKKITVTAPAVFDSKNATGRVTLLVSDDGDHTVTRTLELEGLAAPEYAATIQQWIIDANGVHQIWSNAIAIPACNKIDFDGGSFGAPKADCRNNPGYAGYLYSWSYVDENASVLCPSPWRVPTRDDFTYLDIALGGTGENEQSVDGGTRYNGTAWGGSYGGLAASNSLAGQGSDGYYWTTTQYNGDNGYSLAYYSDFTSPSKYHVKLYGYAVRCVK